MMPGPLDWSWLQLKSGLRVKFERGSGDGPFQSWCLEGFSRRGLRLLGEAPS